MTLQENNYSHVHEKFRYFLEESDETRLLFLDEQRWVSYDTADKLMQTLIGLLHYPKRPRMPNLLIMGDSNNGKTTIAQRFYELHGESYITDESDLIKPVIYAQSPTTASEKGLYIAIIERFFVPYRPKDSIDSLRYQAIHLLKEFDVKMLMIDEFHSMLTGTARQQRQVMNAIKMLCNELQIPIVGIGTKDAVRVLHTDPQHASRFEVFELPTWKLNKDFQKLLYRFEATLPLKKASGLHKPELSAPLHIISEGNLGNLQKLLVQCAKDAINTGEEQITEKIIKDNTWLQPTKGLRQIVK